MIRFLKNVVCLVFVLCIADEVFCIKCWSCESKLDPKCGVPFDNSTMTLADCSTMRRENDRIPNVCYQQSVRVNDVWSYRRDCGLAKNPSTDLLCIAQSRTSEEGDKVYIQHCICFDSDGCNNEGNIYDKKD